MQLAKQFLTLQVELEGATLRRAYSLSSSALDPSRVTVTERVCGLARLLAAEVFGTSTLMPCTDAVVRMMKVTSST